MPTRGARVLGGAGGVERAYAVVADGRGSGDIMVAGGRQKSEQRRRHEREGEREVRERGTVPLTGGLHLSAGRRQYGLASQGGSGPGWRGRPAGGGLGRLRPSRARVRARRAGGAGPQAGLGRGSSA